MRRVMLPLTPAKRRVVIYDQLNPAYAKYYTRREAHDALAQAGVRRRPASPSPRLQLDRGRNAAMMLVSIVAPVYNEAATLGEFAARLVAAAARTRDPLRFEFVLVDDGSTDGTLEAGQGASSPPSPGFASWSCGATSARRPRCRPA